MKATLGQSRPNSGLHLKQFSASQWPLGLLSVHSALKPTVCDNGDGTYCISYSPEEPGLYAVCVCVKGKHVQVALLVSLALLLLYLLFFSYVLALNLSKDYLYHVAV